MDMIMDFLGFLFGRKPKSNEDLLAQKREELKQLERVHAKELVDLNFLVNTINKGTYHGFKDDRLKEYRKLGVKVDKLHLDITNMREDIKELEEKLEKKDEGTEDGLQGIKRVKGLQYNNTDE